jgi:hypothetical protein
MKRTLLGQSPERYPAQPQALRSFLLCDQQRLAHSNGFAEFALQHPAQSGPFRDAQGNIARQYRFADGSACCIHGSVRRPPPYIKVA